MEYIESKKIIDEIRSRNELMFRMSLSHLIDVGVRNLTDENISQTCKEINEEDDSKHFITNDCKCQIVKTAGELAKIDHIHLLVYVQREVTYDVGDNYYKGDDENDII